MSHKWAVFTILVLSLVTRFAFFGHPNEIVFDEVHFGKFVSGYYTHEYFFDIHPPLGKLLIAGFGKFFDFEPAFSFAQIGEQFPDTKYLALRFLPSIASVLLPIVLYFLSLRLDMSRTGSLAVGILISLENAILVQSKFILMDSFLLLFGFTAFLCYAQYWHGRQIRDLLLTGVFGALALSVKWTGATFLLIPLLIELTHTSVRDLFLANRRHLAMLVGSFVVLPLAIYFSMFAIHFALLTKTGSGDAFMKPGFQATLAGNSYASDPTLTRPNLVQKFVQLNVEMYRSNARLTATHPYGSKWYTWPLLIRPIYYWVHDNQRIYLLGNPIIWWVSTVALLAILLQFILDPTKRSPVRAILLGAWLINILPFIGIHRVMFLYHYLVALVIAIIALVYTVDQLPSRKKLLTALVILATAGFVYFAPLTYGLTLTPKQFEAHQWLHSWL